MLLVSLLLTFTLSQAISQQLEHHPESRLQDIYKAFFQEKFGPGHIIPDKASAEAYLQRELRQCKELKDPQPVEYLGTEGRFVRVSLFCLKSGEIEYEDYLDAFIAGAREITDEEYMQWKEEWKEIADAAAAFNIKDYAQDRAEIDRLLEENEGKLVLHHSKEYNEAYEPHYRIIKSELYEKLISKDRL